MDMDMLDAGSDRTEFESSLLAEVIRSFDACPDERLRQLMQALVRHLHEFIREVRLSQEEWQWAIRFLTEVGDITDEHRQEFVLLSDILGASMQIVAVNDETVGGSTEATVFGPFFVDDSPRIDLGGDISRSAEGVPCWVEGTVRDCDGMRIPRARIDVWEADKHGKYDVQYGDGRVAGRAHMYSDEEGRFRFWALLPTPYPIPDDGPVGRLLAAVGRSPLRAPHLHFMVTATGYRRLVTHIFPAGDELLDRDSVFGVKESLVTDFVWQPESSPTPDGRDVGDQPWTRVSFDIVLASGSA